MAFIETYLPDKYRPHKKIMFYHKKFTLNLVFIVKPLEIKITKLNLLTFGLSLFPTALYLYTKHWITNNLFGIIFSITGIETIDLAQFKIGFILLWGLFVYDIFWVFGTEYT